MGLKPIINQDLNYEIIFSSLFRGDGPTAIRSLDIDEDNYIYIAGNTNSTDQSFDISQNAYNTNMPIGSRMSFFTKLRYNEFENQNLRILYNTYLGVVNPTGTQGQHGAQCIYEKDGMVIIGGSMESDGLEMLNAYDD